jgi:hypothetical protein
MWLVAGETGWWWTNGEKAGHAAALKKFVRDPVVLPDDSVVQLGEMPSVKMHRLVWANHNQFSSFLLGKWCFKSRGSGLRNRHFPTEKHHFGGLHWVTERRVKTSCLVSLVFPWHGTMTSSHQGNQSRSVPKKTTNIAISSEAWGMQQWTSVAEWIRMVEMSGAIPELVEKIYTKPIDIGVKIV